MRASFLTADFVIDAHLFTITSHGRRGKGALLGLFYRALIPYNSWGFHFHDLSTSQRPHLIIPSVGGMRFQHMNFRQYIRSIAFCLWAPKIHVLACHQLKSPSPKSDLSFIKIRYGQESKYDSSEANCFPWTCENKDVMGLQNKWWDRHRVHIPVSKGRNKKEKRRSKISPKPNGANNTIFQGLMSRFLDTLEPGFTMMTLLDAAQPAASGLE